VTQATKPKVSSAQTEKKVTKKGGKGGKTVGKAKSAPANMIKKKHQLAKRDNTLFESNKRNFGIGNHVQPKRDLTRFVKWPKYIRVQRQKRILFQRLKIPGTINQFNLTADKNTTNSLFKLLSQHRPETKVQKRERLIQEAKEIVVEQKKSAEEKKENPEKAVKQARKQKKTKIR
jgi:large subunit ribosomal protein L7Ae